MSISVGIGVSKELESFAAGSHAAGQALTAVGGAPDMLFCFASSRFDSRQLLSGIKSIAAQVPLIGCSTAGEITSAGADEKSVCVVALKSAKLHVSIGLGKHVRENSRQAGQEVAREAVRKVRSGLTRHAFMMFADGLQGNSVDVLRGAQEVLGTSFPICGGCAADDFLFKKTIQYYDEQVQENAVVGALFAGDIGIGIGARHGWYPLGKPRIVTDADHNIIRMMDGKPAARIYEDYFDKRVADLQKTPLARLAVMYPLGMTIPQEEECVIRNAMRVDKSGALICAGEVPVGSEIRVMMGSKETALKAARKAAEIALAGLRRSKPAIVFVFDSVSRKRLFGRQASAEIRAVQEVIGTETPLVGFYTYGEQAPLGATVHLGQTFFHNETIVVCAIGE